MSLTDFEKISIAVWLFLFFGIVVVNLEISDLKGKVKRLEKALYNLRTFGHL